jgi:hypothetical protein
MIESILEVIDSTDVSGALRADPALLESLIIEEIERALPSAIHSIYIPQVLDRSTRKRLESSVTGRKGFRALPRAKRTQAIAQLEECVFSDALRTVQHIVSTKSEGSSNQLFYWSADDTVSETKWRQAFSESEASLQNYDIPVNLAEETLTQSNPDEVNAAEMQLTKLPDSRTATPIALAAEKRLEIVEVPSIPIELQEPLVGRNVRGLTALLQGNRIVAFIEPDVAKIIPADIEKIAVPDKKIYRSLKVETLLAEYHTLAVTERLHERTELLTELRLIDMLLTALENDAQWSRINRRRFHLINKKYSIGLSPDEAIDLEELDVLATKRMYAALDLPFNELAMLESYARTLDYTAAA